MPVLDIAPPRRPGRPAANSPDPEQLLTPTQCAELLGVHRNSILAAIARHANGRHGLPARRLAPRVWLIRRADLAAYAANRRAYYPRLSAPQSPASD